MIRLLTAVLLFASFHVVAEDLKTFSDGQVIEADDFNHNFQKLEQDIANGVTGPQGEQGIPGEKGDKGDIGDQGIQGIQGIQGTAGTNGTDGVAAGLNCTTDQMIVYRGGAWVCSSPEYLTLDNVWSAFGTLFCPSGEKVTGGGCRIRGLDFCEITHSRPVNDLSGWSCEAAGSVECQVEAVYAICQ